MFCTRIFLDLTFWLKCPNFLFKSFLQSLRFSLASHVFCLWSLPLWCLFKFLNFSLPDFLQFAFSILILFLLTGLKLFYSFPFFACIFHLFQRLSKEFINILLKDLYHTYKYYLKVFILCFSFVGFLRVSFRIAAGSNGDILCWLLLIVFYTIV